MALPEALPDTLLPMNQRLPPTLLLDPLLTLPLPEDEVAASTADTLGAASVTAVPLLLAPPVALVVAAPALELLAVDAAPLLLAPPVALVVEAPTLELLVVDAALEVEPVLALPDTEFAGTAELVLAPLVLLEPLVVTAPLVVLVLVALLLTLPEPEKK